MLKVNMNGHNTVDQVTRVVLFHLWYGTLVEAESSLASCIWLWDESKIDGSLVRVDKSIGLDVPIFGKKAWKLYGVAHLT